ncbi:translocation/assembly module TamB [Sulfurospirillum sp.]|nr:translocation/assembly module TamB [Sulfurospirillum sp.]
MIKKMYMFSRNIIILTITAIAIFVFVLTNKELIPHIAQKYLKDFEIQYSSIEGTLVSGLKVYDVTYKDIFKAKELTLSYNILALIRPTPKIKKLEIQALHVNLNNLPKTQENQTDSFSMLGFTIANLQVSSAEILSKDKHIKLDLNAKGFTYNNALHVKSFKLTKGFYTDKAQNIDFNLNGENLAYEDDPKIANVHLNLTYSNDKNLTFSTTLQSSNVNYKDSLNAKNLLVDLNTSYADVSLDGKIIKNNLQANSKIKLDENLSKEYLSFVEGIQNPLHVKLNATPKKVIVSSKLEMLTLKNDENLTLKNSQVELAYSVENENFEMKTQYDLSYLGFELYVKQLINFDFNANYDSTLQAVINKKPIDFPIESFTASLSGNKQKIRADLNSTNINFSFNGNDYEHFNIKTKVNKVSLDFLNEIPEILQKDVLSFTSDANLQTSPFSFKGTLNAQSLYANIDGDFEISKKNSLLHAALNPKHKSKAFEEYSLKKLSPINFVLYNSEDTHLLNVDTQIAHISVFKNKNYLEGWGNLSSSSFDVTGDIESKSGKANLKLNVSVPYIHALLDELELKYFEDIPFYDAQADIQASINIDETVEVSSRIDLPWYAFQLDSQTTYTGLNSFIELKSIDKAINIDKYNIEVMDHKVYSNKDSKITIKKDGNIDIQELWIYDNLLLKGQLNASNKEGHLELKSDGFSYNGKEGNITAKTNIKASFDANGSQYIEGNFTFLDGVITYMPKNDYSITDDDIIIIQDVVEKQKNNRFINVHVNSLKPIRYKVKNIDFNFTPDIALFQEKQMSLELLGMVTINSGKVKGAGKSFELKPSEVYFHGDNLNPYLNLNISYKTIDYIDIQIYVTNNVESPVIIFSSNQSMSQDDIMSYILFDGPSSSVFNSSGESSNNKIYISSLLLGSGIKELFNETSAIKIDTLNILNNKEGTLGYEIGSRLSKEFRVVYKNDTVSSVVVQYSVNKSTRIDVDVKETGQGVSLIYTKDF